MQAEAMLGLAVPKEVTSRKQIHCCSTAICHVPGLGSGRRRKKTAVPKPGDVTTACNAAGGDSGRWPGQALPDSHISRIHY